MRFEEGPDDIRRVKLAALFADQPRGQPIDAARPHMTHVVDEILDHLGADAIVEDDLLDPVAARVATRLEVASIEVAPLPQVLLDGRLLETLAANPQHATGR